MHGVAHQQRYLKGLTCISRDDVYIQVLSKMLARVYGTWYHLVPQKKMELTCAQRNVAYVLLDAAGLLRGGRLLRQTLLILLAEGRSP